MAWPERAGHTLFLPFPPEGRCLTHTIMIKPFLQADPLQVILGISDALQADEIALVGSGALYRSSMYLEPGEVDRMRWVIHQCRQDLQYCLLRKALGS